jgi:peptidoglycan/xylan/chitin deacetylase (PgdA/CDA1 family)
MISQLLAENAVLFLKVFKDLLLFPVDPTRQEADKEDMWRDEQVHGKHGSRSHLRLQDAAGRVSAPYGAYAAPLLTLQRKANYYSLNLPCMTGSDALGYHQCPMVKAVGFPILYTLIEGFK